ncbi:Hypothetical predicted protein [Cloeon dipterum]|uniref:OCEL domain-containing protein n=1 Tax=Cloeon dipterum TaxID=197152 RepID=A0A8S1DC26_9INSE|nr:Hypothetical predicted protein [Cloeon dipterum]
MATLLAGEQYGLKSENSKPNKTFTFVKLTDSALRAIEEYLRSPNKIITHPTIKFLSKEEGLLSFPSAQPNNGHTFKFSLNNAADSEGSQGSFTCVQQNGARALDAVGILQSKMQIHAKEDVYEATRKNWVAAEQQQKKNCTRVIKVNGSDIGRKVKKVQKPNNNIPLTIQRREPSPNPPMYQKMPSSMLPQHGLVPNPSIPHRQNAPSAKMNAYNKRPLRERVIHLLALRPFKKLELINRINDGAKIRDRNSLSTLLKQVAQLRDNVYHLNHSLWNDVQDDWPFYSEQEKQLLKRQKPQNLTPPGSDGGSSSGSGQSPASTHPGSPPSIISSADLSAKRPGYYDGADGIITKKPRISHYRRPPEVLSTPASTANRAPSPLSSMVPRGMDVVSRGMDANPRGMDMISRAMDNNPRGMDVVSRGMDLNSRGMDVVPRGMEMDVDRARRTGFEPREVVKEQREAKAVSRSNCHRTPINNSSNVDSSSKPAVAINKPDTTTANPSYLSKFTTIRTLEQRNQYKAAFTENYDEYKRLHAKVEQVANRFNRLQEQLKKEKCDSEGHKSLRSRILKEYEENKSNSEYQNAKQRLNYLHEMLSHVKQLVLDFDKQQVQSYY